MPSKGSVTRWLEALQAGDEAAVDQLWEQYFRRMAGLARKRLRQSHPGAADEEDVALSALDSFCRHVKKGRFADLHDLDSLWRLLAVITARKAGHLLREDRRRKRRAPLADANDPHEVDETLGHEPTPAFAAQAKDECRRLLARLGDTELAAIALWRLEGFAVDEIAAKLDCAPRSVKRKLALIRCIWEKEAVP